MRIKSHFIASAALATALAMSAASAHALEVQTNTGATVITPHAPHQNYTRNDLVVGSSADVNAQPEAYMADATVKKSYKKHPHPTPSNASKQFGMQAKSSLSARTEREMVANRTAEEREIDRLRMEREANMERHTDGYQVRAQGSTAVGTTERVGDARVGIGSNLGLRLGGGTRR
jgi:hypothetical protein